MSRPNPGRVAAVRALVAADEGAHLDAVLDEQAGMDERDRRLAQHLSYGVLRHRGTLDAALQPLLARDLGALDSIPRACLRMGLFEAQHARTGAHAAVDQAVGTCKALEARAAAGLVNAVLRKAVKAAVVDDPALNLPPWLRERLGEHSAWVARLGEVPRTAVVMRQPGAEPDFEAEPATAAGEPVPDCWWVAQAGSVTALAGFSEGAFWVMDPAAARIGHALCALVPEGGSVLDACAAPGGKTMLLASRERRVAATDRPGRLPRLQDNLGRTGLDAEVIAHDWTTGPLDQRQFDAVFVDAPCTSLGTVRRHPEVRWRTLPTDPAAMAALQEQILRQAAVHVAPGGALVYAVCSPLEEEGRGVVSAVEGWTVEREVSTVPPQGDEDAHQAFVLRRDRPSEP